MNKQILDQYNISFYKESNNTKYIIGGNVIGSYLYVWRIIEDIDDFLADINLCLSGQIAYVEDTDYSDGLLKLYGTLKHNELIISDEAGSHWVSVPLSDFKDLLLAWRKFLISN